MSQSLPSPRHVLAENLKILGFKPRNYTSAHYTGVVLNQDAFSGASNTKAFELISWFLFNKLDSYKAKKLFAHCWPIVDYRSQPREYRSAAYKWLEELKKENTLIGDIVLRRSYLEDCRGERIEKIMMALSTLVLKTVMERNHEDLHESLISVNTNDASVRRIMELEEVTMKVNKVVTKLEAQQRQANTECEVKEQKVLQKLKRLDTYQQQVEIGQSGESRIPQYILKMTSNSSANWMESQMMQRLDTLDSLWDKCADELDYSKPRWSKLADYHPCEMSFQIDELSHMWLETWECIQRIQSESNRHLEMSGHKRITAWAQDQMAHYQRRALKAQAIKNMLLLNRNGGFKNIERQWPSVLRRKRSFDEIEYYPQMQLWHMPSLKRHHFSEDRVQEIRSMVRERVDTRCKEELPLPIIINKMKQRPLIGKATSELTQLCDPLSPKEDTLEMRSLAPETKSIKPVVNYDRNGRRIRPLEEGGGPVFHFNDHLHPRMLNDSKKNSAVKSTGSNTISDRVFKENSAGKSNRLVSRKKIEKDTKTTTPAHSECDQIIEQMNNPPLSMITPPRSYSPKRIPYNVSSNFEFPSYTKFRDHKRKLSAAVDIVESQRTASSKLELHNDMFLEHALNVDDMSGNIFDEFPENGAHSTPQKHGALDLTSTLQRPALSPGIFNASAVTPSRHGVKDINVLETSKLSAAAASPANTSLVAYNAAVDDTSVYLFGENLPDNFDDGIDMTL